MPIPLEIKLLYKIKAKLDKLMSDSYTKVEIRSTDLYDFIKHDITLRKEFPTNRIFNQFLRAQHDAGILKQRIPNYSVDTSNKRFYQWRFRKDTSPKNTTAYNSNAETIESKFAYYSFGKSVFVSSGAMVRSDQEKYIFEKLLACKYLTIFYEHPISKQGEVKYADFFIRNNKYRTEYTWEHFGMTNSEKYKDGIPAKIEWYKNNGYRTIEEGGNLIYTYYKAEKEFARDVEKHIRIINGEEG